MLRNLRVLLAVTISILVGCTSQPNLGQPANPLSQATQATPRGQQVTSPEGTWHGKKAGVKFYPSGENLAYDQPVPTVHPTLTGHSQKMVPGVYQVIPV